MVGSVWRAKSGVPKIIAKDRMDLNEVETKSKSVKSETHSSDLLCVVAPFLGSGVVAPGPFGC